MSDDETKDEPLQEVYTEVDDQVEDFDPIQYITGLVNVCKYAFKLSEKENGKVRKGRQNMILTLLLNFEKGLNGNPEKGIEKCTFASFEKNILKIFKFTQ